MTSSKWLLGLIAFLCAPQLAWAVLFVEQADVFSPQTLATPADDATYYGALTGYPHTFMFAVSTTTPVRYQLATKPNGNPVSLLLVRETGRGVDEVARITGHDATWERSKDTRLGVRLAQAPAVAETLQPGVYKLEVSNPDNQGRYQLQIGEGSDGGFWQSVRESFVVHSFYGTWLTALFTWRVLLLLGCVFGIWWLFKRKKKHA